MHFEQQHEPVGPTSVLRADDYYDCHYVSLARSHVYVLRHRRPLSTLATIMNFYVLISALKIIENFSPLTVEDYAILQLGGTDCTAEDVTTQPPPSSALASILGGATKKFVPHALQLDLALQMSQCHAALGRHGELEALRAARLGYYYAFYGAIVVALVVDGLRYLAVSSALGDWLLGFYSPQHEARRLRLFWLFLVPLTHLSWLYTQPLEVACCVGKPKLAVAVERIRTLSFLLVRARLPTPHSLTQRNSLIPSAPGHCHPRPAHQGSTRSPSQLVSSYCLLGDAHHHGYLLLRIPDLQRARARVLRDQLAAPPPRLDHGETSELLGPSALGREGKGALASV